MPLETAPVGSPGFGRNIATERAAGKPEDQAVAIAYSKAEERKDAATAETERKWKIVGRYPNGDKLQFSVLAFDHTEAKRKAEAKKGGAEITDVVLWEGSRKDGFSTFDSLFQAADALYARSDSLATGTWAGDERKDAGPSKQWSRKYEKLIKELQKAQDERLTHDRQNYGGGNGPGVGWVPQAGGMTRDAYYKKAKQL